VSSTEYVLKAVPCSRTVSRRLSDHNDMSTKLRVFLRYRQGHAEITISIIEDSHSVAHRSFGKGLRRRGPPKRKHRQSHQSHAGLHLTYSEALRSFIYCSGTSTMKLSLIPVTARIHPWKSLFIEPCTALSRQSWCGELTISCIFEDRKGERSGLAAVPQWMEV